MTLALVSGYNTPETVRHDRHRARLAICIWRCSKPNGSANEAALAQRRLVTPTCAPFRTVICRSESYSSSHFPNRELTAWEHLSISGTVTKDQAAELISEALRLLRIRLATETLGQVKELVLPSFLGVDAVLDQRD